MSVSNQKLRPIRPVLLMLAFALCSNPPAEAASRPKKRVPTTTKVVRRVPSSTNAPTNSSSTTATANAATSGSPEAVAAAFQMPTVVAGWTASPPEVADSPEIVAALKLAPECTESLPVVVPGATKRQSALFKRGQVEVINMILFTGTAPEMDAVDRAIRLGAKMFPCQEIRFRLLGFELKFSDYTGDQKVDGLPTPYHADSVGVAIPAFGLNLRSSTIAIRRSNAIVLLFSNTFQPIPDAERVPIAVDLERRLVAATR